MNKVKTKAEYKLEQQIKTLEGILSSEITRGILTSNIEKAKQIRKDVKVIKDLIQEKKGYLDVIQFNKNY